MDVCLDDDPAMDWCSLEVFLCILCSLKSCSRLQQHLCDPDRKSIKKVDENVSINTSKDQIYNLNVIKKLGD